jgi:predicted metal-dependent enzyme (double-stranded beta helix superfamily)
MNRTEQRRRTVADAVADIRAIEAREGVTRVGLARIRERLITLATHTDLFNADDFPPPGSGDSRRSALYRLSEDDDHRFALYANASHGGYGTPAHDHTTWAVIVGITGEELNRFYDPSDEDGVREKGAFKVRAGTGVSFMPTDLHSIHIDAPLINFHMYGLGLEQLHSRRYYKATEKVWAIFPPHADIREAR